jgi:phosphate starvation-inducible PhoH-like protein
LKNHLKLRNSSPLGTEKESVIQVEDLESMRLLGGASNSNFKILQKELGIRVGVQGGEIKLSGLDAKVDLGSNLIRQFIEIVAKGDPLYPSDIERAIRALEGNSTVHLASLYQEPIKLGGKHFSVFPKTPNQKAYLEAINNHPLVFGVGPAGTGKTYLAVAMALNLLQRKAIKKIVLCRPAVEAGEKLGFLPGDMSEKVNPYLRPLYDALHDMAEVEKVAEWIERGIIEVAPLAFMRGRTIDNSFIILDEGQNTTQSQMKMFLTRFGANSKCVVNGDVSQIDLPRGELSGLRDAINILKGVDGIKFIYFDGGDIVRHPLVARIIAAYDNA